MHKKTESLLYSGGGLVAAALILVLLNFVLGAARGRIDLTQGALYTLSEGSRAVLGKLESPVKIRLYFSQSDIPLPIKAYGRRVEDLLTEFRQAGRGKVTVEKFDPQPDSDAEDSATLEGVRRKSRHRATSSTSAPRSATRTRSWPCRRLRPIASLYSSTIWCARSRVSRRRRSP